MQAQPERIERIKREELQEKLRRGEKVIIVDARSPSALENSNIKPKNAVRIDPNTMKGDIDRLPKDATIVTV